LEPGFDLHGAVAACRPQGLYHQLTAVSAEFVIDAYHQPWRIEKASRMSKHDLQARPIYHHKRESIEAHLTIVFAALAVSHYIEAQTGWSIKKFVRTARPRALASNSRLTLTSVKGLSERLACKAVGLAGSSYRRLPVAQTPADFDAEMRAWLRVCDQTPVPWVPARLGGTALRRTP
jgi:hypothetical protein